MRASEAETKLCPFSFNIQEIWNVREAGPWQCQTSRCMAWRVYRAAGSTSIVSRNAALPDGFEEVAQDDTKPGGIPPRKIRATEDHGECHALPLPDER